MKLLRALTNYMKLSDQKKKSVGFYTYCPTLVPYVNVLFSRFAESSCCIIYGNVVKSALSTRWKHFSSSFEASKTQKNTYECLLQCCYLHEFNKESVLFVTGCNQKYHRIWKRA